MSSEIISTLNNVMANIVSNKKSVDDALANAEATAGTFSPEVSDAMDLILRTFPSPQIAAQMIATRAQVDQLSKTAGEIAALTAALQVVIADEELVEATQAQATANVGAANSPLPEAAGSSESPAADATALAAGSSSEVASPAA